MAGRGSFNEDPGVQKAQDFSIRTKPLDAPALDVGSMIKSVGTAVDTIFGIKDTNNQATIEDNIRAEAEVSNNIVTDGKWSYETSVNAPSTVTPPDLEKDFQRMKNMQTARTQGKVSESAYWARLNAVAKELRVKFPGYDSIIDQKFSQITGRIPGNALRDELVSQASAEAKSKSDMEKERERWIDQNKDKLPANWRELAATPQGFEVLRNSVYRVAQDDAFVKRKQDSINLSKAQGEIDRKANYDLASKDFNDTYTNNFTHAINSATMKEGTGYAGLAALIGNAKDPNSPGGTRVTPEETAALTQSFTQFKLAMATTFDRKLREPTGSKDKPGPSYAEHLTPDQIKDLRTSWEDRTKAYEDMIFNNQWGLLGWNKVYLDAIKDGDIAEVLSQDDMFRKIQFLKSTSGDQGVNTYLQSVLPQFKKAVDAAKVGKVVIDHASTPNTPLGQNLKAAQPSPRVTQAAIDSVRVLLADKKTPPEVFTNIVNNTFGQGNLDFLTAFSTSERAKVYGQLVNPETTARIREMSKTDPTIWTNYKTWAGQVAVNHIANDIAVTLQGAIASPYTKQKITFDGTKFVASEPANVGLPPFNKSPRNPIIENSVRDINTLLSAYRNVLEAEGATDVAKGMEDVLKALNLDPNAKKNPTIWESVRDSVADWWDGENVTKSVGEGQSKGGTPDVTNPFDGQTSLNNETPDTQPRVLASLGDTRQPTALSNYNMDDLPTDEAIFSKVDKGATAVKGFGPDVNAAIAEAAKVSGMDEGVLRAFASIESSGNPTLRNGNSQYKGLFQLNETEFYKHGGVSNIYDARENAIAAANKLARESNRFEKDFGRKPDAADLYMLHQQGEAGYREHLKNPYQPAWMSMASTGEGQSKRDPEAWGKLAIWGNVPTKWKEKFGSVDNITSKEFTDMWRSITERRLGSKASPEATQGTYSSGIVDEALGNMEVL